MKVQCPECREIVEMKSFRTSREGLEFVCEACGKDIFVRSSPPEGAEAGGEEALRTNELDKPSGLQGSGAGKNDGTIVCPKCANVQQDDYACHKCGLVFEKFDPSVLPPDPPEAAELWEKIQARPDDDDLNAEFIRLCLGKGRADYAARQYRLLRLRPGMEHLADRMLERLASAAQASMGFSLDSGRSRGERKGSGSWLRKIAGLAIVLLALLLLVFLIGGSQNLFTSVLP
ncbi:MAG: hypothetical protein D6806_15340 [Deltaproteobacteria bacterium]|nr:MAG: hypothetical protein D6806_15340 [Deltaproteobacteria bacterium]